MFFETDLRFLCDVFNKCRLQTLILDIHSHLDARIDLGFRQMFGEREAYNKTASEYFCKIPLFHAAFFQIRMKPCPECAHTFFLTHD